MTEQLLYSPSRLLSHSLIFLLTISLSHFAHSIIGSSTRNEANFGAMDDMYGQRKKLETVFYYFDTDGDGVS